MCVIIPSFLCFTLTSAINSITTHFLQFPEKRLFWRQHESFSGCFLLPAAHRRYLRAQPRLLSGRLGCSPAEQRWTGPQPRDSARPSLGMERNFVCRNQRWVDGLTTVDFFFSGYPPQRKLQWYIFYSASVLISVTLLGWRVHSLCCCYSGIMILVFDQ